MVIGGKEVRTSVKCKHCKKDFSGKSIGGTGHLGRHIPICRVLKGRSGLAKSQLNLILMALCTLGSINLKLLVLSCVC